jgi:hypothetical protein
MNDETKANLAASLTAAMTELGEVARQLPDLITDKEIEQHAEILDHLADSAHEGAAILRAALDARRRSRPPLPRRIRGDAANLGRVSPGTGGDAS